MNMSSTRCKSKTILVGSSICFYTMPNSETTDDFCVLDSVGPSTEELLNEKGYLTYEDLAELQPVALHKECNLVLATATQIIAGAVEQLEQECPACGRHSEFSPAWAAVIVNVEDDSDIVCESCSWDGAVTELETEPVEAAYLSD